MNCLEIMEFCRIQVVDGVSLCKAGLLLFLLFCARSLYQHQTSIHFSWHVQSLNLSPSRALTQFDGRLSLSHQLHSKGIPVPFLHNKACWPYYLGSWGSGEPWSEGLLPRVFWSCGQREFTQIENQGCLLFCVGHWTIHKHVGSAPCQLC